MFCSKDQQACLLLALPCWASTRGFPQELCWGGDETLLGRRCRGVKNKMEFQKKPDIVIVFPEHAGLGEARRGPDPCGFANPL